MSPKPQTTPDPIEGWSFTCEWKTDKMADGLNWKARKATSTNEAWVDDKGLHVQDTVDYDPQWEHVIPLAVVETLVRLHREAST